MSDFIVRFLGNGTGPLRSERVTALGSHDVGVLAMQRLSASRVFSKALVYEGSNLLLEVDRAGYRHALG